MHTYIQINIIEATTVVTYLMLVIRTYFIVIINILDDNVTTCIEQVLLQISHMVAYITLYLISLSSLETAGHISITIFRIVVCGC